MNDYAIYYIDCETTSLDDRIGDVIELSIIRGSDNMQKTWCLRPLNFETIDPVSLRINGHKLENITGQTKLGRETYLDPNNVIVEIENWILEDGKPTSNRIMCGQNVGFDRNFLEQLWIKCNSKDTFPFGRRTLDTMQIAFFLDFCKDDFAEGYSLKNLTKKYGVVNTKAHSAEADILATKQVFEKQVEFFKKILNK